LTWKKAGQDINKLLFGFKKRKFPVLENAGILNVQVGKQRYKGSLMHQTGPFESNFNETHALRQMHRLVLMMELDWLAAGHKHYATAQVVYEGKGDQRRPVAYIRTGSEKGTGKVHDKWAIDRYGNTADPTGQTIHLWSNERQIDATCEFGMAMKAHMAYLLCEMANNEK
jgi:hypothetical protein